MIGGLIPRNITLQSPFVGMISPAIIVCIRHLKEDRMALMTYLLLVNTCIPHEITTILGHFLLITLLCYTV